MKPTALQEAQSAAKVEVKKGQILFGIVHQGIA
jgi:hypothetical protein